MSVWKVVWHRRRIDHDGDAMGASGTARNCDRSLYLYIFL